jgi:arylsulfatase A-like enzyme
MTTISHTNIRPVLLSLTLLLFSLVVAEQGIGHAAGAEPATTRPPNIVFVFADDMGFSDLGCNGSDLYRTPNLDRLATQGTRFTHFRTAAHVCSPTRASVLTGKYPARIGLTDYLKGHNRPYAKLKIPAWTMGLPQEETTLAEVLKSKGYATAWLGKWHLGEGAQDHGFDAGSQDWEHNRKDDPQDPKGVFTLNREAFEFMQKHRDQPCFAGISHYSVHGPIRFEPGLRDEYQKLIDEKKPRQTNAGYAAMVEALDTSVGQLLTWLDDHNLAENTLVIFTSDNGGVSNFTNNAPLRAGKGTLYEGGVRVPFIARWPGKIPAGKTSDAALCSIDLLPTFASLAGAEVPKNVDGMNATAAFQGKESPHREALYWHYPHYHQEKPSGAVIAGDWKLIEWFETGKTELFNLKDDPAEAHDVAGDHPQQRDKLLAQLQQWRKDVGAQMTTVNPNYDPARANEGESKPKKVKQEKPKKAPREKDKGATK